MLPIFEPIALTVTIITLFLFVLDIWDEVRAETAPGENLMPLRAASTMEDSPWRSGGS